MSDFANLNYRELNRLLDRYRSAAGFNDGRRHIKQRIERELRIREEEEAEGYRACPDCGADIYDDGTHVLDERDREMNGYVPCLSEEEEYELEEQLYER